MRNVQKWRDGFMVAAGAAGVSAGVARELFPLCQRWHTFTERLCNEDAPEGVAERVENRHRARCAALVPDGFRVVIHHDPRGTTTAFLSPEELDRGGRSAWSW